MTNNKHNQTIAWRFFKAVTAYPKSVLFVSLILIVLMGSFIPQLEKDTRSDAFMPPDHPALVYRNQLKEIFGLKDPMVIAVVNEGGQGVFNPQTLELVAWLTQRVEELEFIDPDRVTSLATENDIMGTEDGMQVEPFFDEPPLTQAEANQVREAVMDFPLYLGSLVARDGSATLIVAELLDQSRAQQVYAALLALAKQAPTQAGETIYVAGEGAVSGYMGAYIDADAQRLNPIAALIITVILFIAFRTLRGMILPNLVVLATVASALGLMAATGVSFFVITNALPIILIGIAVADSIHILSQYYEEIARHPQDSARDIVIRTMCHMWRPVTLTTLTTIAGFFGVYLASIMPPRKYFGLFAMFGVGMAWIYSIVVVPAILSLLKPKPSTAYQRTTLGNTQPDMFGRLMIGLGRWVIYHPAVVLSVAVIILVTGVVGASKLELNEARIRVFQQDEAIVLADQAINQRFDGVHYLDIMIETPQAEDLFKPEHLRRIEALQTYLHSLPHVKGSTSIVDYLKQMNRGVNEDKIEAYRLPDDSNLIAQYFLLYSASADPTDFEEEVDYDYRLANVRVRMDTGLYSVEKVVVEAAQHYVETVFNAPGIQANLSGRVNVDYHWIKRLGESHFGSVAIAIALVLLMIMVSFRSIVAGLITVVPVALSVLVIYAVMGLANIWLAIGTSMFAAIAIGLGVDFSVHTMERLVVLVRDKQESFDEAVADLYPSTGRALLFNFAALTFGFGVLVTSEVVPLIRFGSLVAVAVTVSFLASVTLIPVLVKVFKPRFLGLKESDYPQKDL